MLPGVSGVQWLPMPPGKENFLAPQRGQVLALVRVNLGIGPLEIGLRRNARRTVPGGGRSAA